MNYLIEILKRYLKSTLLINFLFNKTKLKNWLNSFFLFFISHKNFYLKLALSVGVEGNLGNSSHIT